MKKTPIGELKRELFDVIFCDGGIDYFEDVVRFVKGLIKKYKVKDLDVKEDLWKAAVYIYFREEIIHDYEAGKKQRKKSPRS